MDGRVYVEYDKLSKFSGSVKPLSVSITLHIVVLGVCILQMAEHSQEDTGICQVHRTHSHHTHLNFHIL